MEDIVIQTSIPVSEWSNFENFLFDNDLYYYDVGVNPQSYKIILFFQDRNDALIYKLKCLEDIFFSFGVFYFEPDTEFELELEKLYGNYSECDEYFYRHANIN